MKMILDQTKENEHPDVVLLISDNAEAQRMLVSWKNLQKGNHDEKKKPTSLNDIWDNLDFDINQWAAIARVHTGLARDISKMLIANNLIYPDGTLNQFVQKYLNSLVITRISKAKPKK